MYKVFALAALIAVTPLPQVVTNNLTAADNKSYFHFTFKNNNAADLFESKKINTIDTAALKQSDWYSTTIKNIEASEYEIKKADDKDLFAAPNRRQQLKANFSYNSFTLQPRDEKKGWKLNLQLNGIYAGNKLLAAPAIKDVAVTTANKIVFNNNDFSTEYINSQDGVRQNFILQKEPSSKPKTINIKLQTNKGWYINKVHDKELHFAKTEGDHLSKKITYNSLKVWDADNKELDAKFVLNKKHTAFEIEVNTEDAVYPITIDPLSTTASWSVESNQAGAYYGWSVATAGDVNGDGFSDIIVGAPYYDNGQTDEGKVFVYDGSATGLSLSANWTMESDQAGAQMGLNANTAGDVNGDGYSDVIIGSPYYDAGQTDEGRAFVYYGSSTGLAATPAWTTESDQVSAEYGGSVASAGDVNGDGYSDVIVGCPYYDNGNTDEGKAFVYYGSASGLAVSPAWSGEGNQDNTNFAGTQNSAVGTGVACAGDVNGDGYSDVIIGASRYDNGNTDEGKVFVYHGSASGLSVTANWTAESDQNFALMGNSIASAGDVNGDGYSDVIVGAYGYDNGQTNEGKAYLYYGSATGLSVSPNWTAESNVTIALFGCSVACAGDVNGDGYSDVIVGAAFYANGQANEGAAFVYLGSASGLPVSYNWIVEGNLADASLGATVSPAGDVNGDGYSDLIAGGWDYTNGQSIEGAAFVYNGSASGLELISSSTPNDANQAFANFGISVSSAGDINGDGFSDVLIGASGYDDGANMNVGRVFVYHGSALGLSGTPNSFLQNNLQFSAFSWSVASAGDVNGDGYSDVIVGAYTSFDNTFFGEGLAYIYYGSATGLNTVPAATLDDADQSNAFFGYTVACAGDVNGDGYSDVIVGAYGYDEPGSVNEGKAFLYYGSISGVSATPDLMLSDANQPNSSFASSVASAGDVNGDGYGDVIIGDAGFDDGANTDEGRAFLYFGSASGLSATANNILDYANAANSGFGISVATAGDVNGDGFSDLIVGANAFDDGPNPNEGRAFVYYGSATGVSTMPDRILSDANQADAQFGYCVATAGDVNGDGYSDMVIGARNYDDGANMDEGRVYIYYGSSSGVSATADLQVGDADMAGASFGTSVACAGDINGDGYSDMISGAYAYNDGSNSFEGRTFIYYGNLSVNNKRNNLRLYNTDLTTPINSSNFTAGNFGAGLFAKSFLGRSKGKLVWETRLNYNAYSGIPITNSTFFTSQQAGYSDLGLTGTELKNIIAKIGAASKYTKLRARVKYDPVTAVTGQVYSPWRNVSSIIDGNKLGALPINLISFTANWIVKGKTVQLNFTTDKEKSICCFEIEKSSDGFNFITIGTVVAKNSGGRQSYLFVDNAALGKDQFYRLKIKGDNGQVEYSNIQHLQNNGATEILVFPNPTTAVLQLLLNKAYEKMNVQIVNSTGQIVQQYSNLPVLNQTIKIPVSNLPSGNYWLRLQTGTEKQVLQFVKQ
jgi:hypothetical protein